MRRLELLAWAMAIVFVSSCADSEEEILYCNPDDQSRPRGAMHIDLNNRVISEEGTSSSIELMKVGNLVGFVWPFPLLIFDDSVDRGELQEEIVSGDFRFRFTSLESNHKDWWLITASPKDMEDVKKGYSMILYSIQDGVLLMNFSSDLDWDWEFVSNYVPCTNRTLRFDDLRSIIGEFTQEP